jgi:hypothetical protein
VRQEPPGEPPPAGATFDAWLHATFGGALCAAFFVPYNQKIWQHPLHDMQSAWVGDRVAAPQRPTADQRWGPNATFRYPASGGTGAIWSAMAARLPASRIRYGARVASIDAQERRLLMADGTSHDYDVLVSTMPLDALASAMHNAPVDVTDASRHLIANSVELVGIGVRAPVPERLRQHSWRYFPEPASPYYRVTVLSNYSPAMVPDAGCYSLLTESSHPRGTAADVPDLVARTVNALEHDGLIDRDAHIVSTWHHTLARSYRADAGTTPSTPRCTTRDLQPRPVRRVEMRGLEPGPFVHAGRRAHRRAARQRPRSRTAIRIAPTAASSSRARPQPRGRDDADGHTGVVGRRAGAQRRPHDRQHADDLARRADNARHRRRGHRR